MMKNDQLYRVQFFDFIFHGWNLREMVYFEGEHMTYFWLFNNIENIELLI
jgi:hypothetical protein